MALHKNLGITDGIHVPYALEYADDTSRITASGLVSTDKGKFARQLDDDTIWMLINDSPVTWEPVSSGATSLHAGSHRGDGVDAIDTATSSISGLMSSVDKVRLDGLGEGNVLLSVRNETGAQLDKSTPVYHSGHSVTYGVMLVEKADSTDSDKRPALGVISADLANNSNGNVLVVGILEGVDTSSWAETDQLVLGPSGTLVRPPPDNVLFTGKVQNLGSVMAVNASTGTLSIVVDGLNPVTAAQIFAASGTYGIAGPLNPYVTNSDPRVNNPGNYVTVGSENASFTSIKTAIDYVVSQGVSSSSPWSIKVYPGNYIEDPMNLPTGVVISSTPATRIDTVVVQANNSAQDLFTSTGGSLSGLELKGVTDSSKALVRCAIVSTLTILHNISVKGCSTGIAISNGASVVATDFSINIDAVGIQVTTGVSVDGVGSYFGGVGGFLSVPAVLLSYYSVNPITYGFKITNDAEAFLVGYSLRIAGKDTTQAAVFADTGATVSLLSCELSKCYRATQIGSAGSDTVFIIQSGTFLNNTINGQNDSSSGTFLVSAATDMFKWESVPGSVLAGLVQSLEYNRVFLAGELSYWFTTGSTMDLAQWFHDKSSTGVSYPEYTAFVTLSGELGVDVAAGRGWISRSATEHDSLNVEWEATTLVMASGTNYVGYSSSTSAISSSLSPPSEETLLLSTVVTDGSSIRYIHDTKSVVHSETSKLHEYLLYTRKIIHRAGMVVTEGSTSSNIEISSGTYYRALDLLSFTSIGTNEIFSYFYGSNGTNEIANQTNLDISKYDSSGILTNMTTDYFRSDTVIITSDDRVNVIYGIEEFSTKELAEVALLSSIPTFMEETGITIARAVVKEGDGIVSIIDERPVSNSASSGGGGSGTSVHADLIGLGSDDHTQYMLGTGIRAMSGNLNMGSYNIIGVGNVDGVDVSGHASRHTPGSLDALATAVPVVTLVGSSSAEGSASSFAKSDHQHGIGSGTPSSVGTSNAAGSSSSAARSDHVHSGLTRGSNDISTFAEKGTPVSGDLLIIEDSASAGVKKKVQVGNLPGSSDDYAIHDNVASEISAVTEKTVPVSADLLLIEDSADSNSKKRVQIGNLLDSGGSGFGSEFQHASSISESSTTGSWIQKLRMTTGTLTVGKYRVGWACEMRTSTTISADFLVRVQINDSATYAQANVETKDVNSYYPLCGFFYYDVSSPASINIDIDYGSELTHTSRIRNAKLEIWRVE